MPVIPDPETLLRSDDTVPRATVCVVGSGFCGALVAVDLSMAGVEVVLLEAGSQHPDHRQEELIDRVDVSGSTELRFGFSRQLGGASNLWAGRMAPLDPVDFEQRDWIPESGWPLSRSDLDPWYVRAAGILGAPGHEHFGADVARPGFASAPDIELKSFQWARKPFSARDYLHAAARQMENLRVLLNARVVELVESENTRVVRSARIALRGGGVAELRAKWFVLAAGGIETPRLLLNSTAVRAGGIGGGVTGRYLSTHPKANMATLVLPRSLSTHHPLFTDRPLAGGVARYGVGFAAETQARLRLLNHYVQVLPFFEYRANRLFERFRGADAFNSPLIDRAPLIGGYLPGLGRILFDKMGRLGGVQRRARKFILRAYLDQYPGAENRITLSAERDRNGMRKVNVRWRFSGEDRASVLAFFDALGRSMEGHGVERFDYSLLRSSGEWPLIGLHSHFMGTTRMGNDPGTSVTTSDGRIHGNDNTFVAGPSLFPTYGCANPVYTAAALSLRIADHLKTRISG